MSGQEPAHGCVDDLLCGAFARGPRGPVAVSRTGSFSGTVSARHGCRPIMHGRTTPGVLGSRFGAVVGLRHQEVHVLCGAMQRDDPVGLLHPRDQHRSADAGVVCRLDRHGVEVDLALRAEVDVRYQQGERDRVQISLPVPSGDAS